MGLVVLIGILGVLALGWRRRWYRAARRHPRRTGIGLAATIAIAAPLGWYLGSPLVLSNTIDEAPPVVGDLAPAAETPAVSVSPTPSASLAASASPTASASQTAPAVDPSSPPPNDLIERSGTFTGADDFHFGRGTARLIETEPGSFTVRLQDFAVRNGPDLFVYLSPSVEGYAKGAVELGRLKADRGNQNYRVPAGTDVSAGRSVVIWCKQFSVQFATARLT